MKTNQRLTVRKWLSRALSVFLAGSVIFSSLRGVEAGADVWDKQGRRINDTVALTEENIGTLQYVRGDRAQRYAGFDTFRTTWTIDEVVEGGQKVHYVNVRHVFNERRDRFARHFVLFNIPASLYEPASIRRIVYGNGMGAMATSTQNFTTWIAEPTNGEHKWFISQRYIRPNPNNVAGNIENGTVGIKEVAPGVVTDRVSVEAGRWEHDWTRIDWRYQTDTDPDTKDAFERFVKQKSRSIYIDDRSSSRDTVVYEYRARVKDPAAPMNHLLGYNQPAGGWNNYAAVFGTTPDNRPYNQRFTLTPPARTIVENLSSLTESEKFSIREKIKAANASLFDNTNNTGAAVVASNDATNIIVPSEVTDTAKVQVKFTDGSIGELLLKDVVTKKVTASTTTPTQPPAVAAALNYNREDNTAETTQGNKNFGSIFNLPNTQERQKMTRIQLPNKIDVKDLGAMANAEQVGLDPSNPNDTAEAMWNRQLQQIKRLNNIGGVLGNGRYPTGTAINGKGTRHDTDSVTQDDTTAGSAVAELKREGGKIVGILIKGKRYGDDVIQEAGIITSEMLFNQVASNPLGPAKENAKAEIAKLPLTEGEKQNYNNQIDGKDTQAGIEEVLAAAKKAVADLAKAKEEAKAKIDALKHLTPEQKTEYKRQIAAKTNLSDIQPVVDAATQANLDKAKETAKTLINGLEKLSEEEKRGFRDRIDAANNVDQISPIVEEAKNKNAENQALEEAQTKKEAAKKAIDAISGLDQQQKDEFKRQIEEATDPRVIDMIVEEAKGTAIAEQAKQTIAGLPHLNDAQKQALKDAIDADKTEYNINARLADAKALNNAMGYLKEVIAKAEEVKGTDAYTNADQPKKDALDQAKTAAERIVASGGDNLEKPGVENLISNLTKAIEALNGSVPTRQVNKEDLRAEHAKGTDVKAGRKYTTSTEAAKNAYDEALTKAGEILAKDNATQDEVDLALERLIEAKAALDGQEPTNPAPTVQTQPKDIVVFKGVNLSTPVEIAQFTDDTSVASAKIVDSQSAESNLGLTVNVSGDTEQSKKVVISGQTTEAAGAHERHLLAQDNLGGNSALSNAFQIRVVDASVTAPTTAIVKPYRSNLTADDVKAKINFDRGNNPENTVDYEVVLPSPLQNTGKNQTVTVTVRTKAPESASPEAKAAFVPQEKTLDVLVSYNTKADEVEANPPAEAVGISSPVVNEGTLTEQERTAIQNAVVLPENSTGTPSVDPQAKIVVDNGQAYVPVTVSYEDQSTDTVNVPVRQLDNAKYEPSLVKEQDQSVKPALISVATAQDTAVTNTEDLANITAKVEVLHNNSNVLVKEKKVKPEDQKVVVEEGVAKVKVTVVYNDDTEDTLMVPVKQKDNLQHQVTASQTPVLVNTNVSTAGTQVTDSQDVEAIKNAVSIAPEATGATKTLGDVVVENGQAYVPVTVTYADGTSAAPVRVPVTQKQSISNPTNLTNASLVPIHAEVAVGTEVPQEDRDDLIAKVQNTENDNVTNVTLKEPVQVASGKADGNFANQPVVIAVVSYADGSQGEVEIPVKKADSLLTPASVIEENKPVLIDNPATQGSTLATTDANNNSVSDEEEAILNKVNAPATAQKALVEPKQVIVEGDKAYVKVRVTFEDGTTQDLKVPVAQKQSKATPPSLVDATLVPIHADVTAGTAVPQEDHAALIAKVQNTDTDNVTNVTLKEPVQVANGTGNNQGRPVVVATVTYADGTQAEIEIPVKKADSLLTPATLIQEDVPALLSNPTVAGTAVAAEDEQGILNKVDATAGNGTKALAEPKEVIEKEGKPYVKVIVTFPDQTTQEVFVPVKYAENEKYEPKRLTDAIIPVTVDVATAPALTSDADKQAILDNVTVKEKDATVTAGETPSLPTGAVKTLVENGKIFTNEQGNKVVKVHVAYKDGTEDIIEVPVKYADNLQDTPVLKDQKTSVLVETEVVAGAPLTKESDIQAIKDSVQANKGTVTSVANQITQNAEGQNGVEVVVTYEDGTTNPFFVPLEWADAAEFEPSVKKDEPLVISVPAVEGRKIGEEDKKKITANVEVLPSAQNPAPEFTATVEPADEKVVLKDGEPVIWVTVTYPDQSQDRIAVKVTATDTDNDGVTDETELKDGTDPKKADSDNDGFNDGLEKELNTNPKDATSRPDQEDTDGDGLTNLEEHEKGTNHLLVDTDGDGFSDKEELTRTPATDPNDPNSKPAPTADDRDGDGVTDEEEIKKGLNPDEPDTDGDGFSDGEETTAGSEANQPSSTPNTAADEFARAKDAAKKEIQALPNLTAEQKANLIKEAEAATDKPSLAEVLEKARKLNDTQVPGTSTTPGNNTGSGTGTGTGSGTNTDNSSLEDKKQEAKDEISNLPKLTDEEKQKLKGEVDQATTPEKVQEIVDKARQQNDDKAKESLPKQDPTGLEALKELAKDEISNLPKLSEDQKTALKEAIDNANSQETINNILDDARQQNDDKAKQDAAEKAKEALLTELKEKAKEEINNLPNLTQEEKDNFKNSIDQATNAAAIDTTITDARRANDAKNQGLSLDDLKAKAIESIRALPHLTEEEKQAFVDAINATSNEQEVNEVVEAAREQNKVNEEKKAKTTDAFLDDYKASAKKDVDALPNLTQEEKDNFKNQIDQAPDANAVDSIVSDARDTNDQKPVTPKTSLDNYKEEVKKAIDALPNLTDKEKAEAKDKVTQATDAATIDKALEDARNLNDGKKANEDELKKAKEAAKKAVDALPGLSQEQKETIKLQINNATSKEEVEEILEKARKANDTQVLIPDLSKEKAEAKELINALDHLTAEEKLKFNADIDLAQNKGEIAKVLDEARKRSDESTLEKLKEAAIAAVKGMSFLTPEEKAEFINRITAAPTKDAILGVVEEAARLDRSRGKVINIPGEKDEPTTTPKEIQDILDGKGPQNQTDAIVDFDFVGGTLNGEHSHRVYTQIGNTIQLLPAPSKVGYRFVYWKGSRYEAGADYTVSLNYKRFEAVWVKDGSVTEIPMTPTLISNFVLQNSGVLGIWKANENATNKGPLDRVPNTGAASLPLSLLVLAGAGFVAFKKRK